MLGRGPCDGLAAALAYYTAFALPPLLYLLLTVLTFGLSVAYDSGSAREKAHSVLKEQATEMLGNKAAAEEISTILENNRASGGAWWKTLLSFAGIIVGATGVVGALQDSLNRVWQLKPDPETSGLLTIQVYAVRYGSGIQPEGTRFASSRTFVARN